MNTLTITFTSHDGSAGVDSDPNNPLARALNRLLKTGKPFERLSACYFDPLPMARGVRWLGTFVVSDADRLIYFPGLTETHQKTLTSKGTSSIQQYPFQLDHLSLEARRHEWHLTGKGQKPHIGSFRTVDLGKSRVLWFGMSIASADVLRTVRTRTEVEAKVPETDGRRRSDVLIKAREGVVFNTVLFNTTHRQLVIPSFAHFSVIVGPCGFPAYDGALPGLPFGSPYISPPLGVLSDMPLRTHRISLEPHVDLDIVSVALPGRVTVPLTFTSPTK
jgi:hypothetical protein